MVYLEPTRRQFRIDQSLFSSIFSNFPHPQTLVQFTQPRE